MGPTRLVGSPVAMAALRTGGINAPGLLKSRMNEQTFRTYAADVLAPPPARR